MSDHAKNGQVIEVFVHVKIVAVAVETVFFSDAGLLLVVVLDGGTGCSQGVGNLVINERQRVVVNVRIVFQILILVAIAVKLEVKGACLRVFILILVAAIKAVGKAIIVGYNDAVFGKVFQILALFGREPIISFFPIINDLVAFDVPLESPRRWLPPNLWR